MKNKYAIYGILTSAFLAIFLFFIYYLLFQKNSDADYSMLYREIETPAKKILNGYLGHFFHFKYLGNINWILIPFIFSFIFSIRRKEKWEIALFCIYIFTLVLISAKGFFNARYQMTLFPFTIFFILYFLWNMVNKNNFIFYKKYIFLTLFFLIIINSGYIVLASAKKSNNGKKIEKTFFQRVDFFIQNFPKRMKKIPENIIEKLENIKGTSPKEYPVYNYIKLMPDSSKFLVNNLPGLYYYTNKNGIYYWSDDDIYYNDKGEHKLLSGRNLDEIHSFLIDSLNCRFVFSFLSYNEYNADFKKFLKNYCKPIYLDISDFVIYEIQNEKGEFSILPLKDSLDMLLELDSQITYVNLPNVN